MHYSVKVIARRSKSRHVREFGSVEVAKRWAKQAEASGVFIVKYIKDCYGRKLAWR